MLDWKSYLAGDTPALEAFAPLPLIRYSSSAYLGDIENLVDVGSRRAGSFQVSSAHDCAGSLDWNN
jgi:hypothetical protein